MKENIELEHKFIQATNEYDLDTVKLILKDPTFDHTFLGQQSLYTAMINENPELFHLLIKDKRFDLTLDHNELFGATLQYYRDGNPYYSFKLLELEKVVKSFTKDDKLMLEDEYPKLFILFKKMEIKILTKNLKDF